MQDVCNISLPVLRKWLESVKLNIGFPVVRTDGRAVYGHVINKFSGMGRFTYPWCAAGALRARAPLLCIDFHSRDSLSINFKKN